MERREKAARYREPLESGSIRQPQRRRSRFSATERQFQLDRDGERHSRIGHCRVGGNTNSNRDLRCRDRVRYVGELLEQISLFPDPPLLIVTSRLADERLWAEAVNLGAWDVLAQPFDAEETTRIIGFAWLHWRDRHNARVSRAKERKLANRGRQISATGT